MSALPATLDALVALFTSALPGVQVVDGPVTQDVRGSVVAVGLAPQDPTPADASEVAAGLRVRRESFDVLCLARSWSGNDAVKAQRDRTFELVAGVKAALNADRTLGGVVLGAEFAGFSYVPWRTERAQLVVDVTFRVSVDALS